MTTHSTNLWDSRRPGGTRTANDDREDSATMATNSKDSGRVRGLREGQGDRDRLGATRSSSQGLDRGGKQRGSEVKCDEDSSGSTRDGRGCLPRGGVEVTGGSSGKTDAHPRSIARPQPPVRGRVNRSEQALDVGRPQLGQDRRALVSPDAGAAIEIADMRSAQRDSTSSSRPVDALTRGRARGRG